MGPVQLHAWQQAGPHGKWTNMKWPEVRVKCSKGGAKQRTGYARFAAKNHDYGITTVIGLFGAMVVRRPFDSKEREAVRQAVSDVLDIEGDDIFFGQASTSAEAAGIASNCAGQADRKQHPCHFLCGLRRPG